MFCLENPSTGCLTNRPFMRELNAHRRVVDYCRYKCAVGGKRALSWALYPYKKPTALWTNVDFHPRRCNCPGGRHSSSMVGDRARGRRKDRGGGRSPPLSVRHTVPTELHLDILLSALEAIPGGRWVLDLFSGTQSLKIACEMLGLEYVGVDAEESAVRPGGERVKTDLVQDLTGCDLPLLIKRGAKVAGCRARELLLVWMSVPCTTYSQAQTINPGHLRHRDYSKPSRPAVSGLAKRHDRLVGNLVRQL